jgi:hypothetical protein
MIEEAAARIAPLQSAEMLPALRRYARRLVICVAMIAWACIVIAAFTH